MLLVSKMGDRPIPPGDVGGVGAPAAAGGENVLDLYLEKWRQTTEEVGILSISNTDLVCFP